MHPKTVTCCEHILEEGRKRFGAMMGIVSHIHDGNYDVIAVSSETGIPEVGDRYQVASVYCREVVAKKKTVAITEIDGVKGMSLHPLYDAIPCGFYISSPIFVQGEVWGTLNYTSLDIRDAHFTDDDVAFNEAGAASISALVGG